MQKINEKYLCLYFNTMVADYVDNKAILSIHFNPSLVIYNFQSHLTHLKDWYTN